MPLAKSHSNRRAIDRQPPKQKNPPKNNNDTATPSEVRYRNAEDLIDCIYQDIADGYTRTQLKKKLMRGQYALQKKGFDVDEAENAYQMALGRYCEDVDEKAEALRVKLFGRLEAVYKKAIDAGDLYNARMALNDIAKTFLGVGNPMLNLNVNGSKDGNITIKFGFDNEEEEKKHIIVDEEAEIIEEKDE